MMKLRLRLGRWLLRPETDCIVSQYRKEGAWHRKHGASAEAERQECMAIGAQHLGTGRGVGEGWK